MTSETPLAQRVRAALDAAPTSETARRLLEIDAVDVARAYLDASAEVERLRAATEALREMRDEYVAKADACDEHSNYGAYRRGIATGAGDALGILAGALK